jgi:hypothetical protein
MASIITAGNATNGLALSCDNTGILELKTGTGSGTTAVTIDASQNVTFVGTVAAPKGVGGTPAFSAYPSGNQSISNNTYTKILFQTEEFDTNNNFSSSTFTPTVAGYYQVNLSIYPNTSVTLVESSIYKNGTVAKRSFFTGANGMAITSALIYMNGTTDYLDGYAFISGTTPVVASTQSLTYFQASLVRGA